MEFQCRYHFGSDVREQQVCIEVTHAARSGEWQHQGPTCKACREYLRGLWRKCTLHKAVHTINWVPLDTNRKEG